MDNKCCNPFGVPHKGIQKLTPVNKELVAKARNFNKRIKTTDVICPMCRQKIHTEATTAKTPKKDEPPAKRPTNEPGNPQEIMDVSTKDKSSEEKTSEETTSGEKSELSASNIVLDPANVSQIKECTNNLLSVLGLGLIDEIRLPYKKYQSDLITALSKRLNATIFTQATPSDAGNQMIVQLKEKFDDETSDRNMEIKILSVLPKDWTSGDFQREFGENAPLNIYYSTKKLVKYHGILCEPTKKISPKRIDEAIVKKVRDHYYSDSISRACPGIRDYVLKADKDGEKEKVQRRLVLMNLYEAYILYKEQFPSDNIGFSKFASLRPKECILVGSAHGIHETCVCTYHQNTKLTFDSLSASKFPLFRDLTSYRDFLTLMRCEEPTDKCKLNECEECPGIYGKNVTTGIHEKLTYHFEQDEIENVSYKQWANTGPGMRLTTITSPTHEFIDDFCRQLLQLNRHDFIAKKQAEYSNSLKNQLKDDEIIALLDFSENHSFDVQFQIQTYYFGKPQCTIHPICLYYKEDNEIKIKSIIIIAESTDHNINSVYLFQTKLVEYLRRERKTTKKIIFFSDGAAAQYKNRKNFSNLCLFKLDLCKMP